MLENHGKRFEMKNHQTTYCKTYCNTGSTRYLILKQSYWRIMNLYNLNIDKDMKFNLLS